MRDFAVVPTGADQPRMRQFFLNEITMNSVEWMDVKDSIDQRSAIGERHQLVHVCFIWFIRIEQNEGSTWLSNQ